MRALRLARLDCILDTYTALEQRNISIDRLSKRRASRNWAAGDPINLIPVPEHFSVLETAAEEAGAPLFGLEVGKGSLLDNLNVFGCRVLRSATLYDALKTFCRSMPWYASTSRYWLHETSDTVWLCRGQQRGTDRQLQLQEQRMVMRMINLVRLYAGTKWTPLAIHLTAAPHPKLEDTETFADVFVRYRQQCTAIAIPRYLLALPSSPAMVQFQKPAAQIETEFRASAPARDFAGTVQQVIQALQLVNGSRIEDVAEMTGCSVRSLQRQLARDGYRYSELVMRARFTLAVRRLTANDGTMIDIAFDLGYADQSHFSRAFRRWAGMSPREFRRQHAGKGAWKVVDSAPRSETASAFPNSRHQSGQLSNYH